MPCHLLELPDELIVCIVDWLSDDLRTLQELARVNAQFQALAEERLYRHVFFRRDVELQRLYASLSARPARFKAVRSIDLRCQLDDDEFELFYTDRRVKPGRTNFQLMLHVLLKTTSIQEITMESPFCNVIEGLPMWELTNEETWGRTLREWFKPITVGADIWSPPPSGAPLHALKKLTLHLNGVQREFWTADRQYADVFALKNLEELHLSSVNIIDTTTSNHGDRRTNLKTLKLDESNVTMEGLRSILAMPRALEHLYLGENVNSRDQEDFPPGQTYNRLIDRNPDEFLKILSQHAQSLQSLTYIPACTPREFDHRPDIRIFGPGLRDFVKLEEVTMHSYLSISSVQQLFFRSQDYTPPNLQTLHVTSSYHDLILHPEPVDSIDFERLLPMKRMALQAPTTMPNLKTLKFTFDRIHLTADYRHIVGAIGRAMIMAGSALKERGVRFEVFQQGPRSRYVAPLLYGETARPETLVYSSVEGPNRFVADVSSWRGEGVLSHDVYDSGSEEGSASRSGSGSEGAEWETASEFEDDWEGGDGDDEEEEWGVMDGLQE